MDKFKLRPGVGFVYDISEEVFSKVTNRRPPYCCLSKAGDSHYAVCPECDNPIQIVGLFKRTIESGKKPYGRHNQGSIPDLAEYDEEEYKNCSYSNPSWKRPSQKRKPGSKVAQRALALMKSDFDRVVHVLSRDIEIYISVELAKNMLQAYLRNKGWLYMTATMSNLPWILGLTSRGEKLFGRLIEKEGGLHRALIESCPDIRFEHVGKYVKVLSSGVYIKLYFVLTHHVRKLVGEHLVETIDFQVSEGEPIRHRVIYTKTIAIDSKYFLQLVNSQGDPRTRDERYLKIAEELIRI